MKAIFKNSPLGTIAGSALGAGVLWIAIAASGAQETEPAVAAPTAVVEPAPAAPAEEIRPAAPVEEIKTPAVMSPQEGESPSNALMLLPDETDGADLSLLPVPGASPEPQALESPLPGSAAPVSAVTELAPTETESPLTPDTLSGVLDGDPPSAPSSAALKLSLEASAMYDDNIYLSGINRRGDFVFSISPSAQWRSGDSEARKNSFADIKYRATGILFGRMSDENTVDHDARAALNKRFGRASLGVDAHYARRSDPTPDLGGRVTRDEFSGIVSATYTLSERADLEAAAKVNSVRYASAGWSDYDEWVVETFAGYRPTGRSRIAAGVAAGRLSVKDQEDQNFTRALLRVSTDATGALTLRGTGGVEFRQTAAGDRTAPVFSVAADYKPRDGTTVSLEAFRDTSASGSLAGENQTRTGVALRVKQRLGSRLEAAVEAGYEKLDYRPTSANTYSVDREDDYLYLRPSLRYEFQAGRRAELFYNFQRDDSSVPNFSFEGNQFGLLIGMDF